MSIPKHREAQRQNMENGKIDQNGKSKFNFHVLRFCGETPSRDS